MPAKTLKIKNRTSIRVTNRARSAVEFILEPWGEVYDLPSGSAMIVDAWGEKEGLLEVEFEEARITVWGWASSRARLYLDGTELCPERVDGPPVPSVPGS